MLLREEKWVLMSKDRKIIAKGVPRNRYMCLIDESNKRILTYNSEGKARANSKGFYSSSGVHEYRKENNLEWSNDIELEPVRVVITITIDEQ